MRDRFASVKGMTDVLPPEVSKWHFVEEKARALLEAFTYREIRTPLLEYTPLFVRSVGEVTDVVEKQMYSFDDRDGRSVTMRPEGTAPVVRAYIERAQWTREPTTRWYYLGPMFRHERAQRGRLRQFHQVGAEVFGIAEPSVDAEMIAMLVSLLADLGIPRQELRVALNCLGDPAERHAYKQALVNYLHEHEAGLDDESRRRLSGNPLRVLDSANPKVQEVCRSGPSILDALGEDSRRRFDAVRRHLEDLKVEAGHDTHLVRGLDYYTGVIFELRSTSGDLGAQNTLCGGGRYDGLVELLGGPPTPALGFGLGIERVLLALSARAESFEPGVQVFVAPLGEPAMRHALKLAHGLRLAGIRTDLDHRDGGLKGRLKRADKLGASVAVIIGDNEIAAGKVLVRDLRRGHQQDIREADLELHVRRILD